MTYELNVFDQYKQLENRLTRALGITLERSPVFRKAFIRNFAGNVKLGKNPSINLQFAQGSRTKMASDEKTGIPDLALIDNDGNAIIIESKIEARLSVQQLKSHERRAARNDFNILAAVAITGRERDREILASWKTGTRNLRADWRHASWRDVYRLARASPAKDGWAKELAHYMEIFSEELDDKGMGGDVRVMGFAGIPFSSYEDYDTKLAKRTLRALMDDLMEDKKFLGAIGFKKGEVPGRRKKIKNELSIWDYLSPPGGKKHTEKHHFTIGVREDRASAMLTIPNASFRKLENFLKRDQRAEFADLIDAVMRNLDKSGVIKRGGQPYIRLTQRRFRTMTEVFSLDGVIEFDIRTIRGQNRKGSEAAIPAQPAWMELCEKLILNKKGNTEFQIGVRFPYARCKVTRTPKFVDLIKKSIIGVMPVVEKLS